MRYWPGIVILSAINLSAVLCAQDQGAAKADSPGGLKASPAGFFREEVLPILRSRCLKCHGGEPKVKGHLRVDSREALLKGGDLGPAVNLDQPGESLLLQAIRYEGLEMPPSGRLPRSEVEILTRWIENGVAWHEVKKAPAPDRPAVSQGEVAQPAKLPWPYRPVSRPVVPRVNDPGWVRTPIDAFLAASLDREGLRPTEPATKLALIRRVTWDLTGLPPTPEQIDEFTADDSPFAYERLVDRLLASSHYGEAWGRHWLDLVRYAETNGYERDSAKPFAWRYRDYVINAFNSDKPYDRFLHEQVAGDEYAPTSSEALIATGFYRLGIWDDEPVDRTLARYDVLDGIVSTTGQVFLGISINCARCHDHKKDPIPQADYYRLLAFFHDLTDQDGKNTRELGAGKDAVTVMCVREQGASDTHVLLRGNPNLRGSKVEPGIPAVLGEASTRFHAGPGKRRALAEWLTDRSNPMTARVFVNRLWQYHFGRGLVPTPNDFGLLGENPTHPELLAWLAAEFMEGGWRIKPMHRLIVLSNAYRMSSRATSEGLARDPSNRWFWRFPMRRLAAEEVRDSILAVSGSLGFKAGGPSICPPIPREVLAGQSVPGAGWTVSSPDESTRRSVYIHVKRSLLVPILAIHDAADTDSSCPVRYTTTVPTQSLGLLNGEFANEQASRFADRLRAEHPGDVEGQVRRAIRLTTGAVPSATEVVGDLNLISTLQSRNGLDERAALAQFCLMTLNANAFLYLD